MSRRTRVLCISIGFCIFCGLCIVKDAFYNHFNTKHDVTSRNGRHLLHAIEGTCTPPAILEFPNDFLSNDQRLKGGFLIYLLLALYMFWAIAIVCDDYFVPTLDVLCEKLALQTDVAGATFMALGSSAPELFASVIGVFITEGDIGTGTILGSAVFNVLFVIGVCGLFAGQELQLSWWPMVRDLMSYLVSLVILIIVIMDSIVMWYEAVIMMCTYSFYLIVMYFNPQLEKFMYKITNTVKYEHVAEHHLGYTGLAPARDIGDDEFCSEHHHHKHRDISNTITEHTADEDQSELVPNDEIDLNDTEDKIVSSAEDENQAEVTSDHGSEFNLALGNPFHPPEGKWRKVCWTLALPINISLYFTIPDVRGKWCPVSFVVCIVWIAFTSYILVWMVTLIGYTFGVPDTVMGLTLVAFGSSIPDCMSSLFVARKGDGDMACSHTVGSNVFDILLCLGIPWTVKTTIFTTRSSLHLRSHGLFISAFFIMASIVLTFIMMHYYQWKLTKKVGATYIIVYILFISLACVIELNVFGYFNPPMCKIASSI